MKRRVGGPLSVLGLMFLVVVDVLATCGGGGGGGMAAEIVYQVPWKLMQASDTPAPGGLIVYWFPASENELKNSSLRNSRTLALYAKQCVTMGVADAATPLGPRFVADEKLPVAVLAQSDGKIIGKAQGEAGKLKVNQVEKLLDGEMKQREAGVKQSINAAKDAAKKGDKEAAIAQYRAVYDQKCLFPKQGKDAEKELKKLGVTVAPVPDAANFDPALSAQMDKTLKAGLMAENMENYPGAEKLYAKARQMDPADPAPLRYLGELYRHQTGDWDKARVAFDAILDMPADPLSRAVAPVPDAANLDPAFSAEMDTTMKAGLMAENMENYTGAEKLYAQARQMDPADPAPLRYLGELYRHQTGDWDKARAAFDAILAMPADPLSRAVALHGLGKMTIHDGEFLKGLPVSYTHLTLPTNREV